MPATAALTGASGFIGSSVLKALLQAGWQVRALARRAWPDAEPGAEFIQGSLSDAAALKQLCTGAEVLVHCAGQVRGRRYADFAAVNVEGTHQVLKAAGEANVRRLVGISSLAAREPQLSHYAASKRAGEALMAQAQTIAERCILRPPAVYGPRDTELRPLLQFMARGIAPVPAPRGARFSLLHVEDLAAAIVRLAAGDVSAVPGTAFELHDGHPGGYDWPALAAVVARLRGGPVHTLHLPAAVLRALATSNVAAARLFGYAPMLSPGKVRELRFPDWVCDNDPLGAACGWQPRITLEDGLPAILAAGSR